MINEVYIIDDDESSIAVFRELFREDKEYKCKTDEKNPYLAAGFDPAVIFPVHTVCLYGSICRSEIHIYTDWCR